ncbi:hypothetical protein SCLCIDRAFT_1222537 [Scleroderma citrinum Foug A]|uniref:UBC core domain-containing protein n=1 Tax=Scleroderma citrinum Foug A TaxID=1036808 RepID=A0A0C3CZ33_9AGAM|nr:hypothetical protein SCLCIDRAFT_1222537 [Scleroderma citrinum Foug A]
MSLLSGLVTSTVLDLGAGKTKSSLVKPLPPTLRGPSSTSDATPNSVSRAVISTEYASLRYNKHCPSGMYVIPSLDNVFVWDAVLFVHKGYYAGSVLKFTMTFPDNYPEKQPTVQFLTDTFHPLVEGQTGMLNLMAQFRPWR